MQQLSSSTIQRLLNDPSLSPLLSEMIAKAGVYTQAGYQQVLHQFLSTETVQAKLQQWEWEEGEARAGDAQFNEEAANPRPSMSFGLSRLTKSKSFASLFDSLAVSETVINSNPTDADINSSAESPFEFNPCAQVTGDNNIDPLPTNHPPTSRRISNESLASLSSVTASLNLNFNFKDELPKDTTRAKARRRGSLNDPLRASRNQAEAASRIQYLEKMI
jgi:hypothetical protein